MTWTLPGLVFADDLVLLAEDKAQLQHLVEIANHLPTLGLAFNPMSAVLQFSGPGRQTAKDMRARVREPQGEMWQSAMLPKATLSTFRENKTDIATEPALYNSCGGALLFEARAVASCAKPAEDHSYSLGSSGEHHKAYGLSSPEGELFKPSLASGEEHGTLSNDHTLGHSPDAFEKNYAVSDPAEEANWDMCILLYCDPCGRPYKCLDIRKALEELGHGEEIGAMGPLGSGEVWYLRLRKSKTLLSLVSAGSIRIKGRYCTVVEPRTRAIRIKVHWVPFNLPISAIRRAFLQYGIVTKVNTHKATCGTFYYLSTTRCIHLCLMEGRSLEDIPRRLPVSSNISLLVAGPYREPMCYKCRTIGHFRRECTEKRCVKCMRFCRGMCAPSGDEYEPSRDGAQVEVSLQEPKDEQVAHTVTCGSEKKGADIRETAPVAEETPTQQPREVGLDAETDNAGMADQNAPSVNVSFECECYPVLPEEPRSSPP
ncbi:hypothetical protein HPB50_004773 [Hyalomma asiaticum]|uniref:Uncharacterized protein n=1 Tax=Hyalomma asiaticum TaxID=266040 RepID=A0ACB7TB47_HYAAI|nr:hypothetical protein HPB50_004773 [Hyalomma asiaticum]